MSIKEHSVHMKSVLTDIKEFNLCNITLDLHHIQGLSDRLLHI